MLASRRDRLLWPGSVCRATPAHDARGTFENVCCSCTPSGNNHQLAGASRHLHEKCPKGEALGAVCCWSQDRPTPETGGRPPSVCLEHRTVLDDWWAPPRRFHPSAPQTFESNSIRRHLRNPTLANAWGELGSQHASSRSSSWMGRPNRWLWERGVQCPSSWGSRRGARGALTGERVLRFVTLGWHSEGHHVPHVSRYIICVPRWGYSRYTDEEIGHGRRMEGGWRAREEQILPVFLLYRCWRGVLRQGKLKSERERAGHPNKDVSQLDGQMQRRPEVGASPCSLSALAAFFKLIETRLALDQPATRFTLWFRVRDGGLALFARRHIVKPHAPSGGSLSASLQQSGSPDSREAAGCPAA